MISVFRPSPKRLAHWLDHRPAKFERYLAAHPEAESLLENLFALPDQARELLAAAIPAPIDLAERLALRMTMPDNDTGVASVVLDLFGLGLRTVQVLLDEPTEGSSS